MATVITGKKNIRRAQLLSLRAGLKMQILGMKRRGRQASVIVKEMFNIPKHKSLRETLAILEKVLEDER